MTGNIRGSLVTRDAAQVRNPRLMAALRLACVRMGVDLLEQTPAIDLIGSGARVTGVLTPAGTLAAEWVVCDPERGTASPISARPRVGRASWPLRVTFVVA